MKAIIIKSNEKTIGVSQVVEISSKSYLDLQREVEAHEKELTDEKILLLERISRLELSVEELGRKCDDLQHQIKVITGEEEE